MCNVTDENVRSDSLTGARLVSPWCVSPCSPFWSTSFCVMLLIVVVYVLPGMLLCFLFLESVVSSAKRRKERERTSAATPCSVFLLTDRLTTPFKPE